MNRLAGKTAIVTGAASGIGRAASELFAAEGARVVAADLLPDVDAVGRGIVENGGQAVALTGDVAEPNFVAEIVASAEGRFGSLDVAFANAGIAGGLGSFFDFTAGDWNGILWGNLVATFLMVQAAARVMVKQGRGAIVCTASVAGLRFGAGGMPYS